MKWKLKKKIVKIEMTKNKTMLQFKVHFMYDSWNVGHDDPNLVIK
jgi:hypothetical protein